MLRALESSLREFYVRGLEVPREVLPGLNRVVEAAFPAHGARQTDFLAQRGQFGGPDIGLSVLVVIFNPILFPFLALRFLRHGL